VTSHVQMCGGLTILNSRRIWNSTFSHSISTKKSAKTALCSV